MRTTKKLTPKGAGAFTDRGRPAPPTRARPPTPTCRDLRPARLELGRVRTPHIGRAIAW